MKKIILGFGTIGAIAAPVAAVVSCGNSSDKLSGNGYFKSSYKDLEGNLKSKLSSKIFVNIDGSTIGKDASKYISGSKAGGTINDDDEVVVAYTHISFKDYLANFDNITVWNAARLAKFTQELSEKTETPKYSMLVTLIDDVAVLDSTNLNNAFFAKSPDLSKTLLDKAAIQALFDKLQKLI